MKKSILLSALLIPGIAGAISDPIPAENLKILADAGLPLPDSGIKIVPRSTFNLTQEQLDVIAKEDEDIKKYGYIKDDSPRAMEMINFKSHATRELTANAGNTNEGSTHIRSSLNQLKLDFTPPAMPKKAVSSVLGVIPQGSFSPKGWSGFVEFFNDPSSGVCAYAYRSVKASHTAAELAMEDVTYDVNGKATLYEIRGSKTAGFDYKVRWFDDVAFHELECANAKYGKRLAKHILSLAKQIDASQ